LERPGSPRRPPPPPAETGLLLLRHRQVEVLGDGEIEDVGIRLVGDPEPETARLSGRAAPAPVSADLDGAAVGSEEAARDAEQRRFPGRVPPDELWPLAFPAVEADAALR